ncbi:hypothetical protein MCW_00025 [Cardidatus Bartonella washoeensis 085-0475]|uniref:Uncharacterized protein n=1 Tax=Cardidatus Bartonella washoeensis 085-0475 TaxID=1094564 RepID=J1JPT8_9HYPH|nr:hypothetical protein MCW_00025 [Bartonella washoeensis 085-0475]
MSLGALRDVSLKQAREYATQLCIRKQGRFVLCQGCAPLKKRERQKCVALCICRSIGLHTRLYLLVKSDFFTHQLYKMEILLRRIFITIK